MMQDKMKVTAEVHLKVVQVGRGYVIIEQSNGHQHTLNAGDELHIHIDAEFPT